MLLAAGPIGLAAPQRPKRTRGEIDGLERVRGAGLEFGLGPAQGLVGNRCAVIAESTRNRVEITTGEFRQNSV